jgi:hypothetical protein
MEAVWDGIKGERLELRNATFFTSLCTFLFNSILCPHTEILRQQQQQLCFYLVTIPEYLLAVISFNHKVTQLSNQLESYVEGR